VAAARTLKPRRPFVCDHGTAQWHRDRAFGYVLRCRACNEQQKNQAERPEGVTSSTVLFRNVQDGTYAPYDPKGWL
jgi:hypothetical protein